MIDESYFFFDKALTLSRGTAEEDVLKISLIVFSLFPMILSKKKLDELPTQSGRKEATSLWIIDAQSVKKTDNTAQEKGYDGESKSVVFNAI